MVEKSMAEDELKFVRFVRSYDPTCACQGCQAIKCEGKTCAHYGFYPLLKVRIMAKWDNAPFTRKEIKEMEKNPLRITEQSKATCPCGRFKDRQIKELAKNGTELHCPECGNFNLRVGLFYVRLMTKE